MGKLFSVFQKKIKGKDTKDRQLQETVFKTISDDTNFEWQQEEHRSTVVEATEAAKRLSVYAKEPEDSLQKKQYVEDQQKVDAAVEAIKQNSKHNISKIKLALEKAMEEDLINIDKTIHEDSDEDEKKYQHKSLKISIPSNNLTANTAKRSLPQNSLSVNFSTKNRSKKHTLNTPTSYSAYCGLHIQVDVLCSFHDDPWILDKDKKRESHNNHLKIKHSDKVKNVKEYHRNRRVSLTNSHNFLWLTTAVQTALYYAEEEDVEEITRNSLDQMFTIFPIPFRDRIWDICNYDGDIYIFEDDFRDLGDALLIATGQCDIADDITEVDFEIRDMTDVFAAVMNIDKIFRDKRCIAKWSKTARCLSTAGAMQVVMRSRNVKNKQQLTAMDDFSIALLTGFTKRALQHAIAWCTRIFWKLITDIFWDEDDDDDMALPMSLSKYGNQTPSRRGRSRRGTKHALTPDQRQALRQISMESLFPDLVFDGSDDEEVDETFMQYLQVLDD